MSVNKFREKKGKGTILCIYCFFTGIRMAVPRMHCNLHNSAAPISTVVIYLHQVNPRILLISHIILT